jgi:hypothetical protein
LKSTHVKKQGRGGLRSPAGGRPPKPPEEKYIQICLKLPPSQIEWLKENVDNRNGFIVQAIQEAIYRIETS